MAPVVHDFRATDSGEGQDCMISESAANQVTSISFTAGQKVATVSVGAHPQRIRVGHVPADWTAPAS